MAKIERLALWYWNLEDGLHLSDLDPRNNRPDKKLAVEAILAADGVTPEQIQALATYNYGPMDLKHEDLTRISLFDENEPDKLEKLAAAAAEGLVTYDGLPFDKWPQDLVRQIVDTKQPTYDEGLTDDEDLTDENAAAGDEDTQQITDAWADPPS